MTEKLHTIPKEALASHIAILAKTGAGKSYGARGVIEHLLDAGSRVCIVDPTGIAWGLKSSATGKSAGYPVVIFGGSHADLPLGATHGETIAEIVGTSNTPTIIDTSQMRIRDRTQFFADFADAIMRKNRGPLHLVIDECHNFMPQGKVPDPQAGMMLSAANNLLSGGRARGLRIMLISQRPAKVHKDALTQVETLVALRLIAPQDRKAIEEWIKDNADMTKGREIISSLATLKTGSGWVWAPELGVLERIDFPRIRTFDSMKAPDHAGDGNGPVLAPIDVEAMSEKLRVVADEAAANDPKKLKARVAELEKKLAAKPVSTVSQVDITEAEQNGFNHAARLGSDNLSAVLEDLLVRFDMAEQTFAMHVIKMIKEMAPDKPITYTVHPQNVKRSPETNRAIENVVKHAARMVRNERDAAESLPVGESATLRACIQYPNGLERSQLTILTGYKRSSRDAYIARLKVRGYLSESGGHVYATEAGSQAMPNAEPLQAFWLQRLPEGERVCLQILIDAHPKDVAREAIDEQSGYKRSSRDAYLSRLAAKELVNESARGRVQASEVLFE
jgi:hypothetical protein